MKAAELQNASRDELHALLAQKRQRMMALQTLAHAGKIKNVREYAAVRKDAARILTALGAR